MKCILYFILGVSMFICQCAVSQEMREETNAQEVFSGPYTIGRETPATEGQMASSNTKNRETVPKIIQVKQAPNEIKEAPAQSVREMPLEKKEEVVTAEVVGGFANKKNAVAAPTAKPVKIVAKKTVTLNPNASVRIKGMQKCDDIKPLFGNE